jgi:hypothetical protein
VLPLDWGLLLGEPSVSIDEQNRLIGEIARNSRGKIVPFVGIDPRRENAVKKMEFYLKEYHMQGFKLYPATGYDLQDDRFKPIFEKALEYNVPVLIHSGYSFGPFLSKYCTPITLDYLCTNYPNVRIIAAHLGSGFLEQLCWLGYAKPNLYADCSLLQIRCKQNYREFAGNIRLACDLMGSDKVLFGSDWPFSRTVMDNKEYIDSINRLSTFEDNDIQFGSFEIKQILGKNALKLITVET